jgi:hypothetical protein
VGNYQRPDSDENARKRDEHPQPEAGSQARNVVPLPRMCVVCFAPDSGARDGKAASYFSAQGPHGGLSCAAGLSQRELAKRLDRAHSFVGKIESGERQLNVLEFCEYADLLGADPADLLRSVVNGKG